MATPPVSLFGALVLVTVSNFGIFGVFSGFSLNFRMASLTKDFFLASPHSGLYWLLVSISCFLVVFPVVWFGFPTFCVVRQPRIRFFWGYICISAVSTTVFAWGIFLAWGLETGLSLPAEAASPPTTSSP